MGEGLKSSDFTEATKERGLLEKIASIFPGYRGYKEKEVLRETDKLVRDVLYRKLKEISENVRRLYGEALRTFGLNDQIKMLERISMRCDAMSERVRHAVYGYKPLFSAVRVEEDNLRRLIEFDASLADLIGKLGNAVKSLENDIYSGKLNAENLKTIDNSLRELEETFKRRDEVLLGIGGK